MNRPNSAKPKLTRREYMENEKIAWLAGLIDGEGTIGMYPASRKPKGRRRPNYLTIVSVANDDVHLLSEVLCVMTGIVGREIELVYDWRNNRQFVHYHVRVTSRLDVLKILLAIEPYLVGKKAQAQIMINLLRHHVYGSRFTRAELDVIDILKKMKRENRVLAEGNAELNRDIFKTPHRDISRKRVEHIEATAQQEMDLS